MIFKKFCKRETTCKFPHFLEMYLVTKLKFQVIKYDIFVTFDLYLTI